MIISGACACTGLKPEVLAGHGLRRLATRRLPAAHPQPPPRPSTPAGELPDDSKVTVDAPGGGGLTFGVAPDEAAAAARAAEAAKRSSFKKLRVQEPGEEEEDLDLDDMQD